MGSSLEKNKRNQEKRYETKGTHHQSETNIGSYCVKFVQREIYSS